MREKSLKVAAVFWFLSGIRIGAFVTLPIKAVNINEFEVKQWPLLGVKTKNSKHETTYLLNIPDLLAVVKEWDDLVRAELPPDSFWFAPFPPQSGTFDNQVKDVGKHRECRARKDLKEWLNRVSLTYHSPHKFRNGNAVYSVKELRTIDELKAVSQNLMHANLKVNDGVYYGVLSDNDVKERINNLGETIPSPKYR